MRSLQGICRGSVRVQSQWFGHRPHTVTVYNRATIQGLIYPFSVCFPTVAGILNPKPLNP